MALCKCGKTFNADEATTEQLDVHGTLCCSYKCTTTPEGEFTSENKEAFVRYVMFEINPQRIGRGLRTISVEEARDVFDYLKDFFESWRKRV